jgi:AcrR family transcriptional regulator
MAAIQTGVRVRTRRAIVAAALDVLAENAQASLAEVATAAEVSRTTVHRYFPERSDLLDAVRGEIVEQVTAATRRARLDQGGAPAALARVCRELFELGSVLTVLFNGVVEISDEEWERHTGEAERELRSTIERGHAEHSIDPGLTADWLENFVWAVLYTAWMYARQQDGPRQDALDQSLRSLRKTLAP